MSLTRTTVRKKNKKKYQGHLYGIMTFPLVTSHILTPYLGQDVLEEPEREVVEEVNVLKRLEREVELAARHREAVVQSGDGLHF